MIIPGRLRALIVDDNAYARAICAASLKKLGIGDAVEAEGGAAAILALMTEPFDVVLLDFYMPDINGAGVVQILRDERFGAPSQTPIIVMTAYTSRDNITRVKSLGVNEVLTKPFTTDQLGTALGRVLSPRSDASASIFL